MKSDDIEKIAGRCGAGLRHDDAQHEGIWFTLARWEAFKNTLAREIDAEKVREALARSAAQAAQGEMG